MTATTAIAAAIPATVLIVAIVADQVRQHRAVRRARASANRRIGEVRARVAGGLHHGGRSTHGRAATPTGKGAHVSDAGERSQNHD